MTKQEEVTWKVAPVAARRKALKRLCGHHTHSNLTPGEGQKIAAPFGLRLSGYVHYANTGDPKGLHLAGVGRNVAVRGIAMFELARDIARHIGAEYQEAYGRGTGAWRAIEAITAALDAEEAGTTGAGQ